MFRHLSLTEKSIKRLITLLQSIQQHIGGRTQISLVLALKLHHRHGSSTLIDLLHDYGLIGSYNEPQRFLKSVTAYSTTVSQSDHDKSFGLRSEIGPIFSWADTFDLNVSSPNGRKQPMPWWCNTHSILQASLKGVELILVYMQ